MEYLAEPPQFRAGSERTPPVILVTPEGHLASPPLLLVLDTYNYDFVSERGQGFAWIYRGEFQGGGAVKEAQSANPRFRLEIIPNR